MKKTTACTARGPEDVLGYIPHAVGFLPRESLVCLTVTGKELGAVLRVDLPGPASGPRALWEYAVAVLAYLEHDVGSDGTFLAIYQDASVDRIHSGRGLLLRTLQEVLAAAGRPVRDAWLVGTDGWNGLGCREYDCLVDGGAAAGRGSGPCRHPLDLIDDSRLAAEMVFRGSVVMDHPDDSPARNGGEHPGLSSRTEQRSGTQHARPRGRPGSGRLAEVLKLWEGMLDGSSVWRDAAEAGHAVVLRESLLDPSLRDAVYVSAGSCRETAWWGSLESGAVEREPGLAPVPDPVGHVPWVGRFGAVIVAETAEGPDWRRMERFAAALGAMRRESGQEDQTAVLTALGWVEWCRGRGSHASALLTEAAQSESCQALAPLLLQLVLAGRLSGWATRRETSWQRTWE